ncbi:hypothetical protein P3X46_017023, partial [Hevea brasiliensis]
TGVIIQLIDKSNAYPDGVIEDVLVQVNELVFLIDFYILDMEDDNSPNITPILLEKPFLSTSRTMINVHDGSLTMEFNGEIGHFNIFDAMRHPTDVHSVCHVDIIDPLVQQTFEWDGEDKLNLAISYNVDKESKTNSQRELAIGEEWEEILKFLNVG